MSGRHHTVAGQLEEAEATLCDDILDEARWARWIEALVSAGAAGALPASPPAALPAFAGECAATAAQMLAAGMVREGRAVARRLAQIREATAGADAGALRAQRLAASRNCHGRIAPDASPDAGKVPAWEQVIVFCPAFVTGGPEALHQLAHTLGSLPGAGPRSAQVLLALYDGRPGVPWPFDVSGTRLVCPPVDEALLAPVRHAFGDYQVRPCREVTLTARTLLVFPEVLARQAMPATSSASGVAQRALWWLSVDNALAALPELRDAAWARDWFARHPGVRHFHQSDYARAFLAHHQATRIMPLTDYVHPSFMAPVPGAAGAPRTAVALFPRKGAHRAQAFLERTPGLDLAILADMERDGVRRALQASAVYIDFGDHPGCDRVPREAALSGAVVFLHARGAGARFEDHPLDTFYLFTEDDILNGTLAARVKAVLASRGPHLYAQWHYRQHAVLGEARFQGEVQAAFLTHATSAGHSR